MKNLKSFVNFINESKFNQVISRQGIEDYNYEKGEVVTLKHPSWKEKYDFIVTVPGKKPTLRQIDGPREIVLDRPYDFITVEPEKLKKEKPVKEPKEKGMTKGEFERLCKETVGGQEESDHSVFYDLAENQVRYNSRLKDYLIKLIKYDDPYGSVGMNDLIEKFTNELENYAI